MTEIEQLREEIAKLRERVAVLEMRGVPQQQPISPWMWPTHPAIPINPTYLTWIVTCTTTENLQ